MSEHPPRPETPQAMLHRLPDKPDEEQRAAKPTKYIILIIASTAVAGKVQIAKSVSTALSCPLFQGDSLHDTAAKAASLGAAAEQPNETRYQRMWLSKMTRTGLLFPEESRAATEGFSGFGGASSSTGVGSPGPPGYINRPSAAPLAESDRLRRENPALMVVTHPGLEQWHRDSIRKVVGEYGIGVVFVPLEDDGMPVLKLLDPRSMTSFSSFGSTARTAPTLEDEIIVRVNVGGKVEELIDEIVEGVGDVING